MPPKRGRKSQAEKASTATLPAKSNSRKKQVAFQDEKEESKVNSKAGTQRKSRASKVTPVPEIKDSSPKKPQEKPKPTTRGTRTSRSTAAAEESVPKKTRTRKSPVISTNPPEDQGLDASESGKEVEYRDDKESQEAKKPKREEKLTKTDSKTKGGTKKGTGRKGAQKGKASRGKSSVESDEDIPEREDSGGNEKDAENHKALKESSIQDEESEKDGAEVKKAILKQFDGDDAELKKVLKQEDSSDSYKYGLSESKLLAHEMNTDMDSDLGSQTDHYSTSDEIKKSQSDNEEDSKCKIKKERIEIKSAVKSEVLVDAPLTDTAEELEEAFVSEKEKMFCDQNINAEISPAETKDDDVVKVKKDDLSDDSMSDGRRAENTQEAGEPSSLNKEVMQNRNFTNAEVALEIEKYQEEHEDAELKDDLSPVKKNTRSKARGQTKRSTRKQTSKKEIHVAEEKQGDDVEEKEEDMSKTASMASTDTRENESKDTKAASPEGFEGFDVMVKKKDLRKLVMAKEVNRYEEQMDTEDSSVDSEYVGEEQNDLNMETEETVVDAEEKSLEVDVAIAAQETAAECKEELGDMTASSGSIAKNVSEDSSEIEKASKKQSGKRVNQRNVRSRKVLTADVIDSPGRRRTSQRKRETSSVGDMTENADDKIVQPEENISSKTKESIDSLEEGDYVDSVVDNVAHKVDKEDIPEERNKTSETEVTKTPNRRRTSQQQRGGDPEVELNVSVESKDSKESTGRRRKTSKKAVQLKEKTVVEKGETDSTEDIDMGELLEEDSGMDKSNKVIQEEGDTPEQENSLANSIEEVAEAKLKVSCSIFAADVLSDSGNCAEDNRKKNREINQSEKEEVQKKRSRERKSRWDDPRKFEERCKEDAMQKSQAINSQPSLQSTSVPVEIITSKKEVVTSSENVTTSKTEIKQDEGCKVSHVEKVGEQHFDAVILLADSLLENGLKKLKETGSHNIHIILEKGLNSMTIVNVVHKYKGNYSKNALWVLVSGVFNMAETIIHPDCRACTPPVERLTTLDDSYPSVEETAEELQKLVGMVYPVCKQVQEELGSNGLFVLSPPVPVSILLEEAANSHQALHGGCKMHSTYCADNNTLMSLHVSYNMFCDVWTKFACEQMKRWLPVQLYDNFNMAQRGKHIIAIRNPHRFQPYSLMAWVRMMTAVAKMVMTKPFPKDIVSVKSKEDDSALFNHVVVMGNVKSLDYLKELTADFPISFVDQDVDFDEDGILLLKEEQKKWPQGTLYLILSGISGIAEPVASGPKCIRASCDDPLPIFIPKNQAGGDADFAEMSNEDMVNTVVKQAFDFAKDAIDYMKEGSALFLAPIMPLQAVWGGKNSKFSHDTLHKLVEKKSVPVFGSGTNDWLTCAREFERKWIELTMENLEEDSPVYRLYEGYNANKPDIIQFLHDASENSEEKNFRKVWSRLVFNILKDFLKKEDAYESEELAYQAEVHASEYEDIAQEAKSRYTPRGYQNQTSGETNTWKDWSYEGQGQQYSYDNYQSDSSYYGSYGPNSWMMGTQSWPPAGPPPVYPPGPPPPGAHPPGPPPPGAPPPWGAAPPPSWGTWHSGGQPMWGSGPPPPPPAAPSSQSAPPPTWTSAPPPVWTTVPPPVIEAPPQLITPQHSDPGTISSKVGTSAGSGGDSSVKPGGNLMIQNVVTDLKVDQAKKLLHCFGDLSYLKWPLDHLNKPAKFLMACYKERENAEQCVRVLNHVKPFGRDSEAKLVGAASNSDAVSYIKDEDARVVTLIQDILKQIKDEKSLHIKDNSNRVVVSNISNLLTGKMINDIFLGLKANRSFKNLDLGVISTDEEHHFFVCGSVLNVKMMDGYRFPDKKLKVKLVGPDENKEFTLDEKEAAKAEIDLVMKKHIDTLAELIANRYISKKDVNIYTFKTVRCQNDKTCKYPGLCHDYHIWKDRRRCPILFKYSDEMCTRLDSNGKCPAKDKCSKAHSPLEIPFHLKNFRAHICQGVRRKGRCDKTDKICAYLHPGTTEVFFDQQWRDLLVEGLDKTITYFIGAIMNLFKVSKQNCVRVLLITPTPGMVSLLVKSMEALVFSCDQEIQALPEDGKAKKATILVGTPKAVINWMAEEKKRESVNIDRLKALIIDDGPAVVDYIDVDGYNFLIEFAKIKDLNKVITAEKITWQNTTALERLRILTDYKKVYARGEGRSRSSPSRERSSSPSRKRRGSPSSPSRKRSEKYGREHSDKYADDRHRQSKEREKQKYHSSAEDDVGYEKEITNQMRQKREMQQEALLREQEMLLREQARLQEQIRMEEELQHKKQLMLEQERRLEQERYEKERKEKETKERNYEAYLADRENLKREHEKERKLYFDLPEAHPEYQEKYRVFLDQYKSHYPGRNDAEHCHKLWMLFWKELVSSMLETAYKKKRELLESEYMASQSKISSEGSSSAMKRKALADENERSKFSRMDVFDHSRPGTSTGSVMPMTSGHGHSAASQPFQVAREVSSVSVPEAVTIISEVCNFLGELSPALRLVIHKIREVNMDIMETKKIFSKYDNVMILRMASEKLRELSESFPSPNKEKLSLASYHASQLLQMSSEVPAVQKKPYHGLDIKKVAWATLDKDPAFIIQFITNALMYEGVTNPTQDEISDIFITITNTHYSMKHQK